MTLVFLFGKGKCVTPLRLGHSLLEPSKYPSPSQNFLMMP
jgi:hypothetical protein